MRKTIICLIQSLLIITFILIPFNTESNAIVRFDSISHNLLETGKPAEITLYGQGFDENTRVSMYMDIGNLHRTLGSIQISHSDLNEPYDMEIIGNLAYIAGDGWQGLQIIDVSNPKAPERIGSFDYGGLRAVERVGNFIYMIDCNDLAVIDVSDPTNPIKIYPHWDIGGCLSEYYKDMAVIGNIAYILTTNKFDDDDTVHIFDVSDPKKPVYQEGIWIDTASSMQDFEVQGNKAYIADSAGVHIVDLSDSDFPVIGYMGIPNQINTITIKGNTLYVVCSGSSYPQPFGYLYIIDVSNPKNPTVIASLEVPGNANSVAFDGDTAYVAAGRSGVYVIDVSNPQSLVAVGSIKTPGNALDIAVAGNTAFVTSQELRYGYTSSFSLEVIDISNPENLVNIGIGSSDTQGSAECVAVIRNMLYMTDESASFKILDASDPLNPVITGSVKLTDEHLDTENPYFDVAVSGNIAYVQQYSWVDGLYVINVSNPENPQVVEFVEYEQIPIVSYGGEYNFFWAFNGSFAYKFSYYGWPVHFNTYDLTKGPDYYNGYVPTDWVGLRMYAWPEWPWMGSVGMPNHANDLTVVGNTVYVPDWEGLQVINVSDPTDPVIELCSADTPGTPSFVASLGNTLYMAERDEPSLYVIDISGCPEIRGSIKMPSNPEDVEVMGRTVYVSTESDGLQIIDASNPENPIIVNSMNAPGSVYGMAAIGNATDEANLTTIAYVLSTEGHNSNLQIFDVSDLVNPAILGSVEIEGSSDGYPNSYTMTVVGNSLHAAEWANIAYISNDKGFHVVNVSDPRNPTVVGSTEETWRTEGIGVLGHTVYAGIDKCWYVIDVLNPYQPRILNPVEDLPNVDFVKMTGPTVVGNIKYAGSILDKGLSVYDQSFYRIGYLETPGEVRVVSVVGNTAYVVDSYGNFLIFPPEIISSFRLLESTGVTGDTIAITLPDIRYQGNYTFGIRQNEVYSEISGALTLVNKFAVSKAIIVAGGTPGSRINKIQKETNEAAMRAYDALQYQGYSDEDILFLSSEQDAAKADGIPSRANLEHAVKTWAAEGSATDLVVFLAGHGYDGTFQINENENLGSEDLDTWLDGLENNLPSLERIIFIYDACQSGSFIEKLTPSGGKQRITIAGASKNEAAYFLDNGVLSFSYRFWDGIHNGSTIGEAFERAEAQMKMFQQAQIDTNGDAIPDERMAMKEVKKMKIRRGYVRDTYAPHIFYTEFPESLKGRTSATLRAKVMYDGNGEPMKRVWAVISPPSATQSATPDIPVSKLPVIELAYIGDAYYEGVYNGFSQAGEYNISVFAKNQSGLSSLPHISTIVQTTPVVITAVTESGALVGGTAATLWADIPSANSGIGFTRVWVEITFPDSSVNEVDLTDTDGDGRFSVEYNGFVQNGKYVVDYHGQTTEGFELDRRRTVFAQSTVGVPDAYEADDSPDDARVIVINDPNLQIHTFHARNDEDWVKFYGIKGIVYQIDVREPSAICDTAIEIYDESELLKEISEKDAGKPEVWKWMCPDEKFYHVRIRNANPAIFGEGVSYQLEIYQSAAPLFGFVNGVITDANGSPIMDAWIKTDAEVSAASRPDGAFLMIHSPGDFFMTVGKSGLGECVFPIHVSENMDTKMDIALSNCAANQPSPTPDDSGKTDSSGGGGGCFIGIAGCH